MSWHRIVPHRRPASKRNALNAKQRAELLRRQVDTVGRPGQPGGRIRNVISVGMLSEGWDAKTVTHIMGLRAFISKCPPAPCTGRRGGMQGLSSPQGNGTAWGRPDR